MNMLLLKDSLYINDKFINNLLRKGKKEKAFKFFFLVMCNLKKLLKKKPLFILLKIVKLCEIHLELITRTSALKKKKKKKIVIRRHITGRYLLINKQRVIRRSIKTIIKNFKGNSGKIFFNKLIREFFYIFKANYLKSLTLKKKVDYFNFLKKARPSSFTKKKNIDVKKLIDFDIIIKI